MTQVIKTIRGRKYLYFQDSYKINGKHRIFNTLISRNDLANPDLLTAKGKAFAKHLLKIMKATSTIRKTPYHFEHITTGDLVLLEDSLEYIKLLFGAYRKSLTAPELEEFENVLFTKYVHGTTAIEGNTLTENEAFRLLSADLTPANKTVNETLEVANYNVAREYLESYTGPVTEKLIRRLHALLMNGITATSGKKIDAGNYRTNKAILARIGFKPASPDVIEDQLRYLLQEYYSYVEKNIHPLELASYFHQKFEEIHPFEDGNGRVGREILNYMLKQNSFPPIYILPKHRSEYLTALQKGNEEDYEPLFGFIVGRMGATIRYLQSKTSIYSKLISDETAKISKDMDAEDVYERLETLTTQNRISEELP